MISTTLPSMTNDLAVRLQPCLGEGNDEKVLQLFPSLAWLICKPVVLYDMNRMFYLWISARDVPKVDSLQMQPPTNFCRRSALGFMKE